MSKHLEERVSALEAELAKLKGKEPEVKTGLVIGKWHCNKDFNNNWMVFRLSETEVFGFNEDGDWFTQTDIKKELDTVTFTHHPTESEVLERHKDYFKEFKGGVRFKCAWVDSERVIGKNSKFVIDNE